MPKINRHVVVCFIILSVVLFLLWVMLSGQFNLKFLLIGLFSSLVISAICIPFLTFKSGTNEQKYFLFSINLIRFLPYCLWLIGEIIKASISVTKQIFKPHLDYEPRVVCFSMPFENPLASVLLANSIILTPGTITIDVMENGIFEVHSLDESSAEDIYKGVMAKKIAAIFKETCEFKPLYELETKEIEEYIGEDF